MEQVSSIESRTRASFARVKRDIDALKRQVAKLRERDEQLDHALSDYTRTGEFYARLKAIDDRFESLSDTYVTAEEFESGISRLVKETTQLTTRLSKVEKSDLAPEVSALRKELETLSRRTLEKSAFDTFADKAATRLEKLEGSVAATERRLKGLNELEDRVEKLSALESDAKRLSQIEKSLKQLDSLDPKQLEKRLSAIESVQKKVPSELDKRLATLEKAHESVPLTELDKRLTAIEKSSESKTSEKPSEKRFERLADRIDSIESSLVSESKVKAMLENALENVVRVDELNSKIDEFNAALETTADASEVSGVSSRLSTIEQRLDTERHETNAEVTTLQNAIDGFDSRIEGLSSDLESQRHATNAEVSTFADDLNAISTRLEKLEQSPADTTTAESTARLDSLETQLASRVDELASKLAELEKVAGSEHVSPADFDETSDRLAQFEAALADMRDQLEESGSSGDAKITDRLSDIEAQNNAVLAELAEVSDSGVNARVIEDMAGDLAKAQQRIEDLTEEVELYTKSARKGAEHAGSVEQMQVELEFLRNNVAMQDEIEALKAQVETMGAPKGKGENRVTVLSEDLRKLFERQSELEKKILSLETQNRQLRSDSKPEDPLWKSEEAAQKPTKAAKKRDAKLEEKVPLRGPKAVEQEPKAEPEPEPEKQDETEEPKGRFGKMRRWMVDFFTEEVEDENRKDELY